MTRGQLDEMRYGTREWKAGYAAAQRHKRWTVAGVIVATVAILHRRGFPTFLAMIWVAVGCVCLWPIVVVALWLEVRRRRAITAAVRNTTPEPFPGDQ